MKVLQGGAPTRAHLALTSNTKSSLKGKAAPCTRDILARIGQNSLPVWHSIHAGKKHNEEHGTRLRAKTHAHTHRGTTWLAGLAGKGLLLVLLLLRSDRCIFPSTLQSALRKPHPLPSLLPSLPTTAQKSIRIPLLPLRLLSELLGHVSYFTSLLQTRTLCAREGEGRFGSVRAANGQTVGRGHL